MALSTKKLAASGSPQTDFRRDRVMALMEHHKPLFEKEGIIHPKFIPRLCYLHNGEKVVGFYPRELYGGADIYVEFCNRDYVPEDPKRTLWKWVYNPQFDSEYVLSEPHPATGDRRYLIPVKDLVNVTEYHTTSAPVPEPEIIEETPPESVPDESEFIIPETEGAGSDVPYAAMTLRDYIAITWKKPVSHKAWLNELILNTFK